MHRELFCRRIGDILYGTRPYSEEKLRNHCGGFVAFNERCHNCGFPNYDVQVVKDTNLCKECEVAWIGELVLSRTYEVFCWGERLNRVSAFEKRRDLYFRKPTTPQQDRVISSEETNE